MVGFGLGTREGVGDGIEEISGVGKRAATKKNNHRYARKRAFLPTERPSHRGGRVISLFFIDLNLGAEYIYYNI